MWVNEIVNNTRFLNFFFQTMKLNELCCHEPYFGWIHKTFIFLLPYFETVVKNYSTYGIFSLGCMYKRYMHVDVQICIYIYVFVLLLFFFCLGICMHQIFLLVCMKCMLCIISDNDIMFIWHHLPVLLFQYSSFFF